jgi:hypothetical protein
MVGRKDREHGLVGVSETSLRDQRGDSDGRRRVPTRRFENDCLGSRTELAELLGDEKAVRLVADDERRCDGACERAGAQCGFLEQTAIGQQLQELLRQKGAR